MNSKTFFLIGIIVSGFFLFGLFIGSHITEGRMEQTVAALKAENDAKADRLGNEIRNLNGQVDKLMEFFSQTGTASWYGNFEHGRLTANGERFDKNAMTAASPTLPFNSWWRVKRLDTGKTIMIRINDRLPSKHSRILDLSEAAALALDMRERGLCRVMIEPAIKTGAGD